jgi:plastocyanin
MEKLRSKYILVCVAALLVLVSGCMGPKRTLDVTTAQGPNIVVDMTAKSFAFDPDNIVARAGDTLTLHIKNTSGEKHNITVKDPEGKIIVNQDLPAHETTTVEVPLKTAGTYPFDCNVDMHAALGMKGKIEAK